MELASQRQQWLEWRRGGIGSSDASAIHNKSPYCTKFELYMDKFVEAEDEETSFAMDRGNIYEPVARRLFAAHYNIENLTDDPFEPVLLVNEDLPILRASLDGRSLCKRIALEIKYQGAANHKKVADESLPLRGGRIPENYWIQCQHILLVSGCEKLFFVSYNPKDENPLHYVQVVMDEEFLKQHVAECADFWDKGQRGIAPELSEKDFKTLKVKGAKKLANRMAYLKGKLKELETEYEEAKAAIIAMCDHPKMKCGPIRINLITKKGNIEYKNIPAIKSMDKEELEKYRGKSSEYRKVDVIEEDEVE